MPSGITPGTSTFNTSVYGQFFTARSVVMFNGSVLPTSFVNGNVLSATVPPFFGNYPLSVYTPPIVPNINDGGYSDTLYFFSPVKAGSSSLPMTRRKIR